MGIGDWDKALVDGRIEADAVPQQAHLRRTVIADVKPAVIDAEFEEVPKPKGKMIKDQRHGH